MENEVRKILLEAVDIERWADKVNETYTFLDEEEKGEMVERIVRHLKSKGYYINKIQAQ
jgi:N-acetyl-anhydromuramyl-L-alanine amidase AmpD